MAAPQLLQHFQGLYVDPRDAAKLAAGRLFAEIQAELGTAAARRIFAMWGTPPTQRRMNEIRNHGLLSRMDIMTDLAKTRHAREKARCESAGLPVPDFAPPSLLAFAKELAKENADLPLKDRRAAGGTDVHALEKHIRDMVKKREKGLAAGKWYGPITEAQAIRHFGAQKVETSS